MTLVLPKHTLTLDAQFYGLPELSTPAPTISNLVQDETRVETPEKTLLHVMSTIDLVLMFPHRYSQLNVSTVAILDRDSNPHSRHNNVPCSQPRTAATLRLPPITLSLLLDHTNLLHWF